ncbi:hypothetical protein ACRRTK_009042 [Alexandromys fortis]
MLVVLELWNSRWPHRPSPQSGYSELRVPERRLPRLRRFHPCTRRTRRFHSLSRLGPSPEATRSEAAGRAQCRPHIIRFCP